jgi:hypothetical protein
MTPNRVFFPQEALDGWIEEGRIALVGDELTASAEGRRFQLESAVRFLSEVTTGEDPNGLVGKVKTVEQIAAIGAEHSQGSVIMGDHAYEVVDGFLGTLMPADARAIARRASMDTPDDPLGRLLGHGRSP